MLAVTTHYFVPNFQAVVDILVNFGSMIVLNNNKRSLSAVLQHALGTPDINWSSLPSQYHPSSRRATKDLLK